MLYGEYKQKLEKLRRTFDKIWRFRLLILAAVILMLAATAALLGVKGIVYGETIPLSAEYGQTLGSSAKTIFGKTYFEHRPVGETEWEEGEPVKAGDYEVRAVGKTVVGTCRYSPVHTVSISPAAADVKVAGRELIYGEKPEFTAALRYDDRIVVENYFSGEAQKSGYLNISADLASVKVINSLGEDVTSSYSLTVSDGELKDSPRPLTLKTPSCEFGYDGEPHGNSELECLGMGLAEGDGICDLETTELTNAGSVYNQIVGYTVRNGEGEDVTARYVINEVLGTVTVKPREITVKTDSDNFMYDGKAHTYGNAWVSAGELAAGDELNVSGERVFTEANEEGYINDLAFNIIDGNGGRNYTVARDYGKIVVRRRPVTLSAPVKNCVYDGNENGFGADDYSVSGGQGLAEGDSLRVKTPFTRVNAGEYDNRPAYSVYSNLLGREVTSSYLISENFGGLTIAKRPITVTTPSADFMYDGKSHPYGAQDISAGEGELAAGQTFYDIGGISFKDANEEGYLNAIPFNITDGSGRVTDSNYNITYNYGTVTVRRRPAVLSSVSKTFTYNGRPQGFSAGDYSLQTPQDKEGGLCQNHRLSVNLPFTATDAGKYENTVPAYGITSYNTGYGDYLADVTANYIIEEKTGGLQIDRKEISAQTDTAVFEYDGNAHTSGQAAAQGLALAQHRFVCTPVSPLPSQTAAGETINEFEFGWKVYGGETDVTQNYNLPAENIAYGKIIVNKRQVTLKTDDGEFVYDAQTHSVDTYTAVTNTMVEGHYLTVEGAKCLKAGEYPNAPGGEIYKVYDGGGADVSDNYTLTWQNGKVTVKQRPIGVTSKNRQWIYDATCHLGVESDIQIEYYQNNTLGHTVTPSILINPVDAVNGLQYSCSVTITDGKGESVAENYKINYNFGRVDISRRPIGFITGDANAVYDGEEHFAEQADEYVADGILKLVEGHSIQTVYPRFTEAGVHPNDPDGGWKIYADGNRDVSANYTVEWKTGYIVIEQRKIRITSSSFEGIYNGEPQGAGGYELNRPSDEFYELVEGHRLSADYARYTDAGDYKNIMTNITVTDGQGFAVTHNYQVNTVWGDIKIAKREITFTSGSRTMVYNATPQNYPVIEKVENLVAGHGCYRTVNSSTFITDVQTVPNVLQFSFRVQDISGADVSRNYIAKSVWGTLEITQRPFSARTEGRSFVYDGSPHTAGSVTVISESSSDRGIINGHSFTYKTKEPLPSRTDVGVQTNNLELSEWHIYDGDKKEVTGNYKFDGFTQYGNIVISVREVIIVTDGLSTLYDGQSHSAPNYSVTSISKLVAGHHMDLEFSEFTEAGNYQNAPVNSSDGQTAIKVFAADGTDVTDNYKLIWNYGKIDIRHRPVTVQTTGGISWVYDGKSHKNEFQSKVTLDYPQGKIEGHLPQYAFTSDPVAAGEYDYECTLTVWADGREVTGNYAITYEFGKITVEKRRVELSTGSYNGIFDAEEHYSEDYDITSETQIADGQELSLVFTRFVNAGSYDNKPKITVMAGGDAVTANYEFILDPGKIEIERRPVSVTTKDKTWVYDGKGHLTVQDIEVEYPKGQIQGHSVNMAIFSSSIQEAGEYPAYSVSVLLSDGYNDQTNNYKVTYHNDGTVKVEKRRVKIISGSKTWVYDKPQSGHYTYNECSYTSQGYDGEPESGLLKDHYVSGEYTALIEVTDRPGEVVYVDNEISNLVIKQMDSGNTVRTDNYEIETEWGQLRVKEPVKVVVFSLSKTYDGEELNLAEDGMYKIQSLPPDVQEKDVKIELAGKLTDPGELTIGQIYDQSVHKVTCEGPNRIDFYGADIILEIKPITITISTVSIKGVKGEDGGPLYGNSVLNGFWISSGQLLDGHQIDPSVEVVGVLTQDRDSQTNTVSEVKIIDGEGNDVTKYYKILFNYGMLTWTDDETAQ